MTPGTSDHHLVIVGGGVAGIHIASRAAGRAAGRGRLAVTLLDREPAHVWKPMLHTIAAGTRDVQQQQTSYIAQARERGFVYQTGEVTGIDRHARRVHIAPLRDARQREMIGPRTLEYDTLLLAVGSHANDFGTPGVREHCWTIDSRAQAMAFNDEVRTRILEAALHNLKLTIGIVGGGATGVELAAELIQLADFAEFYGAAGLTGRLKVILFESGDRLLSGFSERVALAARARLEKLGVVVRTGARVTEASKAGFHLHEAGLVAADLMVWAAGVKAPDLLASLDGIERTRNGQVMVDAHLRAPGDPHILAVGDCASFTPDGQERPLPPTAQVAHQQARYMARHLPALIDGKRVPGFAFRDAGALVSLGDYGAFGSLGKFGILEGGFIQGRVAQLGHVLLYRSHQARLHGFWRGGLLWLVDLLNARIRPKIRLD